jgi:nucleotide-binding universal stress UspA family protein
MVLCQDASRPTTQGLPMLPIRTILHPTDFSKHSQHALSMACSLAQDFSAQLFLVHLAPPSPPPEQGETWHPDAFPPDWLPNRLLAPPRRVRILTLVETEDRAAKILDIARTVDANLIVLGADGDSGLEGPLVGSVAEQILRDTTFPLLIVRTPWPGRQVASTPPTLERIAAT